jgi:hypothetical protein
MCKLIFPILTAFLLLSTPGQAQPVGTFGRHDLGPPVRMNWQEASAIANYWIRSYLRRPAKPDEVRYWADRLVNGRSPAEPLSALLSDREYYTYAGGSPQGFLRQLIADVGHHEAGASEIRYRLDTTRGLHPRDIALGFLREFPANWWPGPLATPPRELQHLYGPPGYYR